jgi:Glyoxalase-like domain
MHGPILPAGVRASDYRRRVVSWVSASLAVPPEVVDQETDFWVAVTGGPLPDHLVVRPTTGPAGVRVEAHQGEHLPVVPAPASFPGVRRSRVYQVCIDVPSSSYDAEADRWVELLDGRTEVLARRPEFAWLALPGGRRPLDVLLQRLERTDGASSAHLDLGTPDREAETRRHVALGATVVTREEFWTVLSDPAGLPYCITDRDPATGELIPTGG